MISLLSMYRVLNNEKVRIRDTDGGIVYRGLLYDIPIRMIDRFVEKVVISKEYVDILID